MISPEIKNIIESIIFASDDEINARQIREIIEKGGLRISTGEVEEGVSSLTEDYRTGGRSFELIKIAGGYTFATKKEYGRFIGKLFEDKQKKRLSPSALETLAIIAYKQPITRSEMEFIRGVNVDYIVNTLLEKDLITIHGRAETPGRPILYGTTKTFLKVLGLHSTDDLPKLKEINEILNNQEIEGITEADIELFNSVNNPDADPMPEEGHQLELISSDSEEVDRVNRVNRVEENRVEENKDEENNDEDHVELIAEEENSEPENVTEEFAAADEDITDQTNAEEEDDISIETKNKEENSPENLNNEPEQEKIE
ncbi:MAG: SMC-Scp complex subunit ScpB [bacterium]|nr:SMC-Scp complex subunit ScpB [bacterium]